MKLDDNLKTYIKSFSKVLRNKKFCLYYNTSPSVILKNGELKLYRNIVQDRLSRRFSNLEVKTKQRGNNMNLAVFINNVKKYEAKFLTLNTKKVKVILLFILKGSLGFVQFVQKAINFALSSNFQPFNPIQIYFKRILGIVLLNNILNKTDCKAISLVYTHPKIASCKFKAILPQPILNFASTKIFKQPRKSKEEKIQTFFNSITEHLAQTYRINLHQFCITALTFPNHSIKLNGKNTLEITAISEDVLYEIIHSVWSLLIE